MPRSRHFSIGPSWAQLQVEAGKPLAIGASGRVASPGLAEWELRRAGGIGVDAEAMIATLSCGAETHGRWQG